MSQNGGVSKIQLRAQILQSILKFKNCSMPSDAQIEECIAVLSEIKDKDFVAALLLKEISANGQMYDNILSLILLNVCETGRLSKHILEILSDKNVCDAKKMYLINLLREQGARIDYDFIQRCVNDPEEAINSETKKFLEDAKISPETQIDFFDFYFTVNPKDRKMLICSIMDDYSSDELANILAPFFYFHPQSDVDAQIIDAIAGTKSYLAIEPLKWFIETSKDEYMIKAAKKALNCLKLAGLRNLPSKTELYKPLFKDSKPLGFYFSLADGNSDLSCVFARKKNSGLIQTFFSVINLFDGVHSSFGFNEVCEDDFKIILRRFFKSSTMAVLPLCEGKKIFDELSLRTWKNAAKVPYEFVCWRQLTYDIEPSSDDLHKIFTRNMNIVKLNKKVLECILNSEIFSSWFYQYKNLSEFASIVDKISSEKIVNMEEIETLISTCTGFLINANEFREAFFEKIMYQAYILNNEKMQSAATALYSATKDDELSAFMLEQIIKRSLYEHFLSVSNQCAFNGRENIFAKKENDNPNKDFAGCLVKKIEEKWT